MSSMWQDSLSVTRNTTNFTCSQLSTRDTLKKGKGKQTTRDEDILFLGRGSRLLLQVICNGSICTNIKDLWHPPLTNLLRCIKSSCTYFNNSHTYSICPLSRIRHCWCTGTVHVLSPIKRNQSVCQFVVSKERELLQNYQRPLNIKLNCSYNTWSILSQLHNTILNHLHYSIIAQKSNPGNLIYLLLPRYLFWNDEKEKLTVHVIKRN